MRKSVAIILDGGFVLKKLPHPSITQEEVYSFAQSCIDGYTEELFRIFFYHCSPYEETVTHPISRTQIDFKTSSTAAKNRDLLSKLSEMNYVAVRKGRLAFRGWTIRKYKLDQLQRHASSQQSVTVQQTAAGAQHGASAIQNLRATDFEADFTQKEVDIKIGLDVAWLASKNIVDKIILVTGDTDLVPAMKFARREGVQVVIVNIASSDTRQNNYLRGPLKEHADEVRTMQFVNGDWKIIH